MATDAIVDLVQQRTGQESPEPAERLIEAVLQTLGELDLNGAQAGFAAALPVPYGDLLQNPDTSRQERFDSEEFVRRVAQRTDISVEQADTWTHAGLTAIIENVPTEERNRFVVAFPEDLRSYTQWVF